MPGDLLLFNFNFIIIIDFLFQYLFPEKGGKKCVQYLLAGTNLLQEPGRSVATAIMGHTHHHQLLKLLAPDLHAAVPD